MNGSTIFYTVFSGVLVFVIGQIVQKFLIEPIHNQKRVIGEIADALIFYANIYTNPVTVKSDSHDKASDALRQLSTRLISKTHLIPLYNKLSLVKIVTKKENLKEASRRLIRISNSMHPSMKSINFGIKNTEDAEEIAKLLNLKI